MKIVQVRPKVTSGQMITTPKQHKNRFIIFRGNYKLFKMLCEKKRQNENGTHRISFSDDVKRERNTVVEGYAKSHARFYPRSLALFLPSPLKEFHGISQLFFFLSKKEKNHLESFAEIS